MHNPGDPHCAEHRPQLQMHLFKGTGGDANFTFVNHGSLPIIFQNCLSRHVSLLQKNASAIRYRLYCAQIELRCSPPVFKLLLSRIKTQEKSKLEKFILSIMQPRDKHFYTHNLTICKKGAQHAYAGLRTSFNSINSLTT